VRSGRLSWLNILGIAVALAMDALAVSIAVGLSIPRLTGRHVFRLGWHFGLFQFMMPIIGWVVGRGVAKHIAAYDHWVAFGLLGIIGGKMLYEAIRGGPHPRGDEADPTRGWSLMVLSVATSIDALVVGMSMGVLDVSVWVPAVVIGVVAGVLTIVGIRFGSRLGAKFEHWAEAVGGVVLLAIGLRILISHLVN